MYWAGTIDYSGRIREKCLKYLMSNFTEGDENRIILRMSDWVGPIRVQAKRWVLENLDKITKKTVLESSELILFVSRKESVDREIWSKLEEIIVERCDDLSPSEFSGLSTPCRKYYAEISLRSSSNIRSAVLNDSDPNIRSLLLHNLSFGDLSEHEIQCLKNDKSIFVRKRLYQNMIDDAVTPSKDELIQLIFSNTKSLREFGQFYIKKIYNVDSYQLYKECEDERFYFIADYLKSEDMTHFLKGALCANKELRVQSLKAIVAVDSQMLLKLDLDRLLLDNNRVRHVIYPVLPFLLTECDLVSKREVIVKRNYDIILYLRLLERKSFWLFIREIIKECNSDNEYVIPILEKASQKSNLFETVSSQMKKDILTEQQKVSVDSKEYGLISHLMNGR